MFLIWGRMGGSMFPWIRICNAKCLWVSWGGKFEKVICGSSPSSVVGVEFSCRISWITSATVDDDDDIIDVGTDEIVVVVGEVLVTVVVDVRDTDVDDEEDEDEWTESDFLIFGSGVGRSILRF